MKNIMKLDFSENEHKLIQLKSVYVGPSCNLVLWKSLGATNEGDWVADVKLALAKTMDRVADLLHDYQKFSPLVTLIEIQDFADQWNELAGDQDWHRGRFVVQCIDKSAGKNTDDIINRWLGPIRNISYHPRKVTNDDFKKSVMESIKFAKAPKGSSQLLFSRYADNLVNALDFDMPSQMTSRWSDELVDDLNNLLGKSILGDMENE